MRTFRGHTPQLVSESPLAHKYPTAPLVFGLGSPGSLNVRVVEWLDGEEDAETLVLGRWACPICDERVHTVRFADPAIHMHTVYAPSLPKKTHTCRVPHTGLQYALGRIGACEKACAWVGGRPLLEAWVALNTAADRTATEDGEIEDAPDVGEVSSGTAYWWLSWLHEELSLEYRPVAASFDEVQKALIRRMPKPIPVDFHSNYLNHELAWPRPGVL